MDMTSEYPPIPALDFAKLTEGVPRGAWVAVSSSHDRRIACGDSAADVIQKAAAAGETRPLILRVPKADVAVFLSCR